MTTTITKRVRSGGISIGFDSMGFVESVATPIGVPVGALLASAPGGVPVADGVAVAGLGGSSFGVPVAVGVDVAGLDGAPVGVLLGDPTAGCNSLG